MGIGGLGSPSSKNAGFSNIRKSICTLWGGGGCVEKRVRGASRINWYQTTPIPRSRSVPKAKRKYCCLRFCGINVIAIRLRCRVRGKFNGNPQFTGIWGDRRNRDSVYIQYSSGPFCCVQKILQAAVRTRKSNLEI